MRRLFVLLLSTSIMAAAFSAGLGATAPVQGAPPLKKHCTTKIVKRKVHGKIVKTKKKVCSKIKVNTPLPTETPVATATSMPTLVPTNAPASNLDPLQFALSASDFPPQSTIQKNQVESNDATKDDLGVHFGTATFAQEGRITGYYMQAIQSNAGHPVITYYLVSIFSSRAEASAAFDLQKSGWEALLGGVNPIEFVSVIPFTGIGERVGFYLAVTSQSNGIFHSSELLFTRGRVLVEVYQAFYASDLDLYGKAALGYQISIAKSLDVKAQSQGAFRTSLNTHSQANA